MTDFLKIVYRRAMTAGDPALLQLCFEAAVVDRYREDAAFQVIRTDTAGRIRKQGGWSIDFGIAEDGAMIHASWGAISTALPESERAHWAAHATAQPLSENFLKMQMAPASCFDDGDIRSWT